MSCAHHGAVLSCAALPLLCVSVLELLLAWSAVTSTPQPVDVKKYVSVINMCV